MRESFSEYKKTLELNLQNVPILYSGDIISSSDCFYSEIKNSPLTSPSFIINCIIDIYKKSFQKMELISQEVKITDESCTENLLDKIVTSCGKDIRFIFSSERGRKKLSTSSKIDNTKALPGYLYSIDNFIGLHLELLVSPLIQEEDEGETIFFVTDNSIQSLVWSIQNMDYLIEQNEEGGWKHTMVYKLYDCKFNSWKIVLRNLSKVRHDKINQILNGN